MSTLPQLNTVDDVQSLLKKRDIRHVQVAITDINGVLRGKFLSTKKFLGALDKGFGFCDVINGTDIDDQLCPGLKSTGWHTGYPDAGIDILLNTARETPFSENSLLFLGQFQRGPAAMCPRSILSAVVDKARNMGFTPQCALEYEFSIFNYTLQSNNSHPFADLKPLTPGNAGYSMLRLTTYNDFYDELLNLCEDIDIPLEGLHTEIGPGLLEAAISYDEPLAAGDKASLFKTYSKALAQQNELMLTFMAKWDVKQQGQGGHTHISLLNQNHDNVFFDFNSENNISNTMRHFIGGQQQLLPEFLAMIAPNANSFARLTPGFWSPTQASYGIDNRTTALRAITGKPSAQRVEYRAPGADANPYLAIAAALGSGLWGIEHEIEPTAPITGNAYDVELPDSLQFPRHLSDSAQRFRHSTAAKALFGEAFVNDLATLREWEARENNRHISSWHLQRYFELA